MYLLRHLLLTLCITLPCLLAADGYTVTFSGVENEKTLKLLEGNSQLYHLREKAPKTKAALKRRADSDIPDLLKVMQSQAYYDARIEISIDFEVTPIHVMVTIDEGKLFSIADFAVAPWEKDQGEFDFDENLSDDICEDSYGSAILSRITLGDLDISLEQPAYPKTIIKAEDKLLAKLGMMGFPLASVKDREVSADLETQTVSVTLIVDTGSYARFGQTTIKGCTSVNKSFVCKKIEWLTGKQYNPCLVSRTVEAIEAANLFSSINISHADELDEDGTLPMTIQLVEGKHRTISAGISLSTQRGIGDKSKNSADIGGMLEWEHRNIRGLGEKISLSMNIWSLTRRGSLLYQKPDFIKKNQDYLLILDYEYDKTLGFTEESYQLSSLLERHLNCNTRVSFGGVYKWIDTRRSDNDGTFNIIKSPLHFYWNNANSLLDPTYGITASIKTEPSMQVTSPQFFYWTNKFTGTAYYPLRKDHRLSLAGKVIVGSILGTSTYQIPPSERFYAGSENTLRGYRYLTVSPFDDKDNPDKPTGGRSMLIYSLEARMRTGENLGWVVFTDIGNVYNDRIPQFNGKKLASIGGGLRYFTPIGPLRFDIAFPLDRRKVVKRDADKNREKYIDGVFQVYISIGQAF